MQNGKIYNSSFIGTKYEPNILPQPSQQFIEKYIESYNKGEIITDVLVEYDEVYDINHYTENFNYNTISLKEEKINFRYNLKVNPKDNTITINLVKKILYTQEQVIKLLHQDVNDSHCTKDRVKEPNSNKCADFVIKWFQKNKKK